MQLGYSSEGFKIVPFSKEWIEDYIGLSLKNDVKDPIYIGPASQEEIRQRLKFHESLDITKTHLLAIKDRRVVGSAKVNLVQTCGEDKKAYFSLMVAQDCRGQGIGTALLNQVCNEMSSQGVENIEMGMIESWKDWTNFLEKRGFKRSSFTSADVILQSEIELPDRIPHPDINIRSIRLPEDKEGWIEFVNQERREDMPEGCAVIPEGPMYWELEPEASHFDPNGFLIAEEKETGEIVGYVFSIAIKQKKPRFLIMDVDVARKYMASGLKEHLILEGVKWLREKGAREIKSRIHPEYRKDEEMFRKLGFDIVDRAFVWRKKTSD